jgi:uncharacterized protein YecA (UPF0149 family)
VPVNLTVPWAELDAAVHEEAMHAEWSRKIAPTVGAVHAHWLPYREGSVINMDSSRPKRMAEKPKVGRNAPCPCGSGKKFQHCCGSSGTLH